MRTARLCGILLAALVLLVLPPQASATYKLAKGFWGPTNAFPIYKNLGTSIYQMKLRWADTAPLRPLNPRNPKDPAYLWPADIDSAIAQAKHYHMRVLLMVWFSPRWANGGKDSRWAPTNPRDYADFMYAASRRYPGVHLWMVWGEPQTSNNFQPLTADAPRIYAGLLDAAYGALKQRSGHNLVIGGSTFTAGDIKPVPWVKNMRLPNGKRPRLDLYAHNPFTNRKPDLLNPPLGPGLADFSDLRRFGKVVDKNLGWKGHSHLPLFLSDWAEPTAPGDTEFGWSLTPAQQADWIKAGFKIARAIKAYCFGYVHLYDTD